MLFVLSEGEFSSMQKHIFFYAQAQINVFAGSCIFDAEGEDMPHRERFLAAFGGPGVSVPTDRGKRGQDTIWFPVPS